MFTRNDFQSLECKQFNAEIERRSDGLCIRRAAEVGPVLARPSYRQQQTVIHSQIVSKIDHQKAEEDFRTALLHKYSLSK